MPSTARSFKGRIRRLACAGVLALALCGGALTASAREIAGVDTDDIANGIWGILQTRAAAERMGERGIATSIVRQNDSSLGLTCFERALVASSRLGRLFSDAPPEKIMPPTRAAFSNGPLYNVYAGIGLNNNAEPNMLVNAYASLVNTIDATMGGMGAKPLPPPYDEVNGTATPSNNYASTTTGAMGATEVLALPLYANTIYTGLTASPSPAGLYSSVLTDDFENPLRSLFDTTAVGDLADLLAGALFVSNAAWKQFQLLQSPIDDPTIVLSEGIGTFYAALEEVMDYRQLFYRVANDSGMLVDSYLAAFVNLTNDMFGLGVVGLTGKGWPTAASETISPDMGCPYIKYLYAGIPGNPLGITGVTGGGPTMSVPYFTYAQLIGGTLPNAGRALMDQLTVSNGVMENSRRISVELLRRPRIAGGLSTWKPAPVIPTEVSVTGVVSFMP